MYASGHSAERTTLPVSHRSRAGPELRQHMLSAGLAQALMACAAAQLGPGSAAHAALCHRLAAALLRPFFAAGAAAAAPGNAAVGDVLQWGVALEAHVLLGCMARAAEAAAGGDGGSSAAEGERVAAALRRALLAGLLHPHSHARARALHLLQVWFRGGGWKQMASFTGTTTWLPVRVWARRCTARGRRR